jgi:hypothetical protein
MAINVELINQTKDWMNAHPEHHDQMLWHCGTSHCFFGIAEMLSKGKSPSECFLGNSDNTYEFSKSALGLTEAQACYLCSKQRTIDEINEAVEAWTNPNFMSSNKVILALSPYLTPEDIDRLSQDRDEDIRRAIARSNLSSAIFLRLSKDDSYRVRLIIAKRLDAPLDILRQLSQDKDEEVKERALNTLSKITEGSQNAQ